jgi:hypothetical protein
MRKRLLVTIAGAAIALAPFGLTGGAPAHAMTCAADPPIDAGCDVVFGVLGLVCTGTPPKLPTLPVALAVARPDLCPPLG